LSIQIIGFKLNVYGHNYKQNQQNTDIQDHVVHLGQIQLLQCQQFVNLNFYVMLPFFHYKAVKVLPLKKSQQS